MKKISQPGLMLYWEVFELIKALSGSQVKALLCAMERYVKEQEEPSFQNELRIIWPLMRQRLDSDMDRYETVVKQNKIKGMVSAFRRVYAPEHGVDPFDSEALCAYLREKGVPEDLLPGNNTAVNSG